MKFLNTILLMIFMAGVTLAPAIASEIPAFSRTEFYEAPEDFSKKPTKNQQEVIEILEKYMENEEYTQAMLELNKILAENPSDPRIYIMSAKILRKTYQFDEAERMVKKALTLDYKNSRAYLELGYIYFDRAKLASSSGESPDKLENYMTKSFDLFFIASQYDQADPFPHIALAEAYYANRQKHRANDEILKAKELSPGEPEAYYQIGEYFYRINDFKKARKYIEESIASGRNRNYKAYYLAGRISEEEGDIKEAQQLYLQTLKLKPNMIAAQKHLDSLIKTTYKKRKETTPVNLFAQVDKDLNLLLKADYYLMLDEFTKARDLYIELLRNDPENSNAAAGLAELYYSRWKEGFSVSGNFTRDAIYILKSSPSKRNKIAFLKFQMINESGIPESINKKLIDLSMSETYEFYDLLNEVRAEYLLGNYEECHKKLYNLLRIKLSNYEKFKVLKHLCYDHNYYEALIVLNDLKKTYYHNEEIEPVEKRIKTKLRVAGEKLDEALMLWEEEKYVKALSIYKEIIDYFPAYKPAYLHYALALEEQGSYDMAYDRLNTYYRLYKLYPDKRPEIEEDEIRELIQELYTKTREQIKEKV